jgi:hypothetical protein
MNKKGNIIETLKLIGVILITLLIIAVITISTFLVLTSLTPAIKNTASGRSGQQTLTSVTYIPVNTTTGYLFSDCAGKQGGRLTSVVAIMNNGTLGNLTSGNYSLTGCYINGTSAITKHIGWNITSGTFDYVVASENVESLSNNVTEGLTDFFTQIPTIMIVLGIVILIGAIVLIIVFVSKLSGGRGVEVGL